MEQIGANQSFGGQQLRYKHQSSVLNCEMTFSIYLPPQAKTGSVPVMYWLSGLTCNDENFVQKAGAQQHAAEHGIAIVCPDTSPRGDNVADDPEGAYDMGLGAGFYVNATQKPWAEHYQMYRYIVEELPALINAEFPVDSQRASISGHSMGGHGALTIALKNPHRFKSVSAFSPICSPLNCPWGEKTLRGYLGEDKATWAEYDSVALVAKATEHLPVLVDQGDADNFLADQLKTELLVSAAQEADYPMEIRMQPNYDHSYFFIATFIGEHIAFHARALA
ncbi:S-formylglutathione hydrolase [bacterium]|nr:S-formylglutathione hydrolase [Porticoccaceae bacterium]MDB4322284.1 S-formylglutathione hydrolase [bacterium]MDB9952715.1 S-formylglutathione hydrolase [Porticoccaceae bacterium]MDB9999934.1 S-formylglutathione hydrolase [Porticoccaceae bacterium]MDC0002902.1 S-formylglutathione hydrolase [Porticoccaceae bacterium]